MALYRFCDLTLESDFPLETAPVTEAEAPWTFNIKTEKGDAHARFQFFHHQKLSDGQPWLSLGRRGSCYLLSFVDVADFLVFADCRLIDCYGKEDTTVETIRHLLLDQVLPRVLSQQGRTVLHGSAVCVQGEAVAFLGDGGWGKSTLVASFCRLGFPHLTDDCLLLSEQGNQFFVIPSYPGLRLWPDSMALLFPGERRSRSGAHYTGKMRINPTGGQLPFCPGPTPLRRLYVLSPDSTTGALFSIRPLSRREALAELIKHTYRLDITDRGRLRKEFAALSRVATSLTVSQVAFKRDLSLLPATRDAILETLSEQ